MHWVLGKAFPYMHHPMGLCVMTRVHAKRLGCAMGFTHLINSAQVFVGFIVSAACADSQDE